MNLIRPLSLILIVCGLAAAQSEPHDLQTGTRLAYEASDPRARSEIQAEAVARESAGLAGQAVGAGQVARADMLRVFRAASLEAAQAFEPAYGGGASARQAAVEAAGAIAYRYLPAAIAAADGRAIPSQADLAQAERVLRTATLHDAAALARRNLGIEAAPGTVSGERLIDSLRATVPAEDRLSPQLEQLPRRSRERAVLAVEDMRALDLAVRLANATRRAGEVHRAVLEGDPSRIDPRAGAYQSPDAMRRTLYDAVHGEQLEQRAAYWRHRNRGYPPTTRRAMNEGPQEAQDRGLARVGYEVYKDLHAIKIASAQLSPAERGRALRRTTAHLGQLYTAELERRSLPELVMESGERGLPLRLGDSGPARRALIRRLSDGAYQQSAAHEGHRAEQTAAQGQAVRQGARGFVGEVLEPTAIERADLERVYRSAANDAARIWGEAYGGEAGAVETAREAAARSAYQHVAAAAAALEGRLVPTPADFALVDRVLERATIDDVARVVGSGLGVRPLEIPGHVVTEIERGSRWEQPAGLRDLPQSQRGDPHLAGKEAALLRFALRLGHATGPSAEGAQAAATGRGYEAGLREVYERAHAVARASHPDRGQGGSRTVYDGWSGPTQTLDYEAQVERDARQRGVAMAAYEAYQGLERVQHGKASAQDGLTPGEGQRIGRRLGMRYAEELYAKSTPALVEEARARGLDVGSGGVLSKGQLVEALLEHAADRGRARVAPPTEASTKRPARGAADRLRDTLGRRGGVRRGR